MAESDRGVVERKEFDGKPVSRDPAERIRRSFRPSNLEHLVAVLAAKIRDIVHESNAGQTRGFTVRTGVAVCEKMPQTLGNDSGIVGILAAFHTDRAVTVEDVNGEGFGVFGRDEHAAESARFPKRVMVGAGARRRQRGLNSTK